MKPTPQAIRAAEALFNGEFLTEEETAEIIDREMGGWRPIKEIPTSAGIFIVGSSINKCVGQARWMPKKKGWVFPSNGMAFPDVTHFRELPTPPTP